jgi:hypothetical protein
MIIFSMWFGLAAIQTIGHSQCMLEETNVRLNGSRLIGINENDTPKFMIPKLLQQSACNRKHFQNVCIHTTIEYITYQMSSAIQECLTVHQETLYNF